MSCNESVFITHVTCSRDLPDVSTCPQVWSPYAYQANHSCHITYVYNILYTACLLCMLRTQNLPHALRFHLVTCMLPVIKQHDILFG